MKNGRYSDAQIMGILKQAENGVLNRSGFVGDHQLK